MEQINKRLRELRKFLYIGQGKTGIGRSSLSLIEGGKRAPTLAMVETLSETYGISLNCLFSEEAQYQNFFLMHCAFVAEVLPLLKHLSAGQKEYILKVLQAAPQKPQDKRGRRPAGQ